MQQNNTQAQIRSWVGCFETNNQNAPILLFFKVVGTSNQLPTNVLGHCPTYTLMFQGFSHHSYCELKNKIPWN